jgi:hypothetical protein
VAVWDTRDSDTRIPLGVIHRLKRERTPFGFWVRGSLRRDFAFLTFYCFTGSNDYDPVAAVFLLPWKHSRQNTGRPWVGLNGTVVSLPQLEQTVRVSTFG